MAAMKVRAFRRIQRGHHTHDGLIASIRADLIEQVTIITKDVRILSVDSFLYDGPPGAATHPPKEFGVFFELARYLRGYEHPHNPAADSFALIF
jgi:hypothetical protein